MKPSHSKKKHFKAKATGQGIVVSAVNGGNRRLSRKFTLLGMVALVVIAGIVTGLLLLHSKSQNEPTVYISGNGQDSDQTSYDKQITDSQGKPANQAALYSQKATLYFANKQYDLALQNAQQAERLDPNNPRTAELFGDIYVKQNKAAQAVSSYEKARDLARKTTADTSSSDAYYNTKIAAIQDGQ